jgi:hypothetical protein
MLIINKTSWYNRLYRKHVKMLSSRFERSQRNKRTIEYIGLLKFEKNVQQIG